ncbi:MAG: anhydro-N-acetylmuramic acid kinase [Rhodobiaceae bacterium]|nr:anhydro-N-acetylmuramic acid kinase [Rhodobiaceae bacterium]
MTKLMRAIGLMSGTSMDGIDVALLETDGENQVKPGPSAATPYSAEERTLLRRAIDDAATWKAGTPQPSSVTDAEILVTQAHAEVVARFMEANGLTAADVDLIGFHGQTVLHQPEQRRTVQIGLGQQLADLTGIDVVNDFRSADVAAGGEGAPFAPLYHKALAASLGDTLPIAVLNLGGVGNVTWLGPDDAILAFDTGPANGLIDDWVHQHGAGRMDEGGKIAARGKVNETILATMLDQPFFNVTPPKSLDRLDFSLTPVASLNLEDGAATLTAFTAACVARARELMSALPTRWIVCGGGRKNPTLMKMLNERLGAPVEAAEAVGWRGDDIEAEAFAYLAVRSRRGLPLSVPGTTGVPKPQTGGQFCRASASGA